jgi:hypothetical protein
MLCLPSSCCSVNNLRDRKPAHCLFVDEALATFNGLVCDRAIASNTVMNELLGYLRLGEVVWKVEGNQTRPKLLLHSQNVTSLNLFTIQCSYYSVCFSIQYLFCYA